MGVVVINLDLSIPFTAARARNEGAKALLNLNPQVEFIQFVDGDCEVQAGWLEKAYDFIKQSDDSAVVCGRRRERYPSASVFNQLCDLEWDTPVGEAKSCGGDALIRVRAFKQVNGYNETLIAGEEPEMCFRMRQHSWKIMRLNCEMTLHDASMTRVSQWWKRHKRAGHAYAESYFLHGNTAEKFRLKEVRSNLLWSGFSICILIMTLWQPIILIALSIYPLQIIRLTYREVRKYKNMSLALMLSISNSISKFPQTLGILMFIKNKVFRDQSEIIEYK